MVILQLGILRIHLCNRICSHKGPIICEIITSEDQDNLFSQKYKDNGDGTFSPLSLEFMN